MVKVSVFYPNRKDTRFDMEYYCNRHIPMVRKLVGSALKGASVDRGLSGEEPDSPAPYVAIGHLLFDSVGAFQISFGPHAQAIMDDIPNTRTWSRRFRSVRSSCSSSDAFARQSAGIPDLKVGGRCSAPARTIHHASPGAYQSTFGN
jgi:uncharacterized protein (TIGR02118 family)